MFVIAFSNAFDGIYLVGPFETREAAEKYAAPHHDWNIVQVEAPDPQ